MTTKNVQVPQRGREGLLERLKWGALECPPSFDFLMDGSCPRIGRGFFKDFIYLFLEQRERREKEGEKH